MEVLHYMTQLPTWLASKFARKPEPFFDPLRAVAELSQRTTKFAAATTSALDVHAEHITDFARELSELRRRVVHLEKYAGMTPPDDYTPTPTTLPVPAAKPKLQLVYDHNTHSVVRDVDKPLSPALQVGTAIAAQALMESNARQNAKPDEVLPVA